MILRVEERYEMIEQLVDFIASREIYSELGEPILFDEGDVFFICKHGTYVHGFAAINKRKGHCFLKYMYVIPEKRGNGIFNQLYKEIEAYANKIECGCIKAVSTNMGLPIYLKNGFIIDKGFKNYHKISKQL